MVFKVCLFFNEKKLAAVIKSTLINGPSSRSK
jgi:hypothetical protein